MYFGFFYGDWTLLLLLPGLILGMIAQSKVKNAFNQYSKVFSRGGMTGAQVAQRIMSENGVYDVPVDHAQGRSLSDHYDPRDRVLRLSDDVYGSTSIAALGVAAHEAGHACQHSEAYAPLTLRNSMAPVVQFSSMAVFPILILGVFAQSQLFLNIAIGIYLLVAIFQLITLPVEINASHRAMVALERGGYLASDELPGTRAVLNAAALTYVAAAVAAMLQLLRLILLFSGRRRR